MCERGEATRVNPCEPWCAARVEGANDDLLCNLLGAVTSVGENLQEIGARKKMKKGGVGADARAVAQSLSFSPARV